MKIREKNNKRVIINWIFLILWMSFIFYMSNQQANVSDGQSLKVISILGSLGIDVHGTFGELANFIVRKCAHFLEYMILSLLLLNVIKMYLNLKKSYILSIICVFLYACTDEFHQLFVPGREGAFRDVMIDTCGGIALIVIYILFIAIKNNFINRKFYNKKTLE